MAELSSTEPRGTALGARALLVAVTVAAVALAAWMIVDAPAPDPAARHWLRAAGGGLCLAAVLVAATATEALRGSERRRPFISEVLAAFRRHGASAPRSWAAWTGSLLANTLLMAGATVFLLDALRTDGELRVAVVATAVTLMAVVLVPLAEVDPRRARLAAFAHPVAAASFYGAALVLSVLERAHAGSATQVLIALHVASSAALIALALLASVLEYGWRLAVVPIFGARILLDTGPRSRARWVRGWQWASTLLVGAALAAGALGV